MGKSSLKLGFISRLFFVFALISCSNDVEERILVGSDYFPDKPGLALSYHIDTIVYNDFTNTIDTIKDDVRYRTGGTFLDNSGRTNRLVFVEKLDNFHNRWVPLKVFSYWYTEDNLVVNEDNVPLVYLSFPIIANRSWNGNLYNGQDSRSFRYSKVFYERQIDTFNFKNNVEVTLRNDSTLISRKQHKCVFTKDIGLTFSEYTDILIKGSKVSGKKVIVKLTDYKN